MSEKIKPSLADDPTFQAGLDALDRGLTGSEEADDVFEPPPAPPAPSPQVRTIVPERQVPAAAAFPILQPATGARHRPLLDLFPLEPALSRAATASAPSLERAAAASAPMVIVKPAPDSAAPPAAGTRRRGLLDSFPPAPGAGMGLARAAAPAPPMRARAAAPGVAAAASAPADEALTAQRFYGIDEKPFELSTDPKFLYHSAAHDRVAQTLLSAIRSREPLVIVTGETGSGKTMLCRAIIEELDRRTLTSLVTEPVASIEDVLKTVLIDFGVVSRDEASRGPLARASLDDLLGAVREFLASLAALQAFAVVLIDDAQDVPVEVLARLGALLDVGKGQQLLQLVLVGEPRLLRLLGRSNLRALGKRASVRSVLGGLQEDEIAGYVMHRIAVAGRNARVEFDDAALALLYETSAGLPRTVNVLCNHALTLGGESTAGVIDEALIARAAEDLGVAQRESAMSAVTQRLLVGALTIALMLAGAAGAAFVFRDRVAQAVTRWQAVPAPRTPAAVPPAVLRPLPLPDPGPESPPPVSSASPEEER